MSKASRAAFGEALLDLGARDERIVTLDADLSKSTMTAAFAKKYPGRAFNLGIAEANMIGRPVIDRTDSAGLRARTDQRIDDADSDLVSHPWLSTSLSQPRGGIGSR